MFERLGRRLAHSGRLRLVLEGEEHQSQCPGSAKAMDGVRGDEQNQSHRDLTSEVQVSPTSGSAAPWPAPTRRGLKDEEVLQKSPL